MSYLNRTVKEISPSTYYRLWDLVRATGETTRCDNGFWYTTLADRRRRHTYHLDYYGFDDQGTLGSLRCDNAILVIAMNRKVGRR